MIRNCTNEKWREIFIMKTANTSRNTTTTQTNDPDLIYAMKNGRIYLVELWFCVFSSSSSPGFKYTIVTPTHAAVFGWIKDISTSGTITRSLNLSSALPSSAVDINPNASLGAWCRLQGQIAPTADGNFGLQWAQQVSNGTDTSVTVGSFLKIRERYP